MILFGHDTNNVRRRILTSATGALQVALTTAGSTLGRLAAAASLPVVLSNEDLAAVNRLAGFETLTAINYGGGDQTLITDGSNGIWVNTAGDLKVDTWMGASGVTFTVVVGLFPLRRVKKIYQTGSTAAGFIGYPPV